MWLQKTKPQQPQPRSLAKAVENPADFPSGSAVETEEGNVYFIKGKTKHLVFSDRVVDSWRFNLLQGTEKSVSKFKVGQPLGFRNGTLIKNVADSKMYLISDNKKRHIQNPSVFDKFGMDIENTMLVSEDETNLHEDGEVLS